jgi:hypothetical protein
VFDRTWLARAANRALWTYPGPVGELIQREIEAFLSFGYRFGDGQSLMRLAEVVMACPIGHGEPFSAAHTHE